MSEKTFSKKEAIKFGWEAAKSNFGLFFMLMIIVVLISGLTAFLEKQLEDISVLSGLVSIVSWVISIIIQMGVIKIALKLIDGGKPELPELFSQYKLALNFILASILYGLIVIGGLILLIVPGIIWAIKYGYYSYLIVDKNLGPVEAIKKSGQVTMGAKGQLFVFGLLLVGVTILGALALGIGLLWAVPTTIVACAYVYRKLQQITDSAAPIAAPAPAMTPPASSA